MDLKLERNPKTIKGILKENSIKDGQKWGSWSFKESSLVLELNYEREGHNFWYEVFLGDCYTSATVLDWIMQVADKTWTDDNDEILANLVRALRDCLEPQANLCGSGISRILSEE